MCPRNESSASWPVGEPLRGTLQAALAAFEPLCDAVNRGPVRLTSVRRAAVALVVVEAGVGPAAYLESAQATEWSHDAALLITRRVGRLRQHAGQWALPGGRLDADETPTTAALRELEEEVGLALDAEAVIGCLDDYPTRSGYLITPVVVWGGSARALRPNPDEVASVHRIPFAELLRRDAPMLEDGPVPGHPVLRMPVGTSWIAAPTAALLYQFRECCLLQRSTRVAHFDQPAFAWR